MLVLLFVFLIVLMMYKSVVCIVVCVGLPLLLCFVVLCACSYCVVFRYGFCVR